MALQVVDIYEGNTQRAGKALGEVDAYKQRTHQTWSTRKGHSTQLFLLDASTFDGLMYHRYHILLVCAASQLRHHTAIRLMDGLRSRHVRQQHSILQHRSRRVIATRLYT